LNFETIVNFFANLDENVKRFVLSIHGSIWYSSVGRIQKFIADFCRGIGNSPGIVFAKFRISSHYAIRAF